jgi:hypothetical protein
MCSFVMWLACRLPSTSQTAPLVLTVVLTMHSIRASLLLHEGRSLIMEEALEIEKTGEEFECASFVIATNWRLTPHGSTT